MLDNPKMLLCLGAVASARGGNSAAFSAVGFDPTDAMLAVACARKAGLVTRSAPADLTAKGEAWAKAQFAPIADLFARVAA